ncbi:MAG: hypothetical protein RLZZ502_1105, partial [Pseudomonadota bacterium]
MTKTSPPQALSKLDTKECRYLLTDIDDTLTTHGRLQSTTLQVLEQVSALDIKIIPVTGRPAGYCQVLLTQWPIDAIIAENGCVAYLKSPEHAPHTWLWRTESEIKQEQHQLHSAARELKAKHTWVCDTQDQFMRIGDRCFDHAEYEAPWSAPQLEEVCATLHALGVKTLVSSIHVHSYISERSKWRMCERLLKEHFQLNDEEIQKHCVFIG